MCDKSGIQRSVSTDEVDSKEAGPLWSFVRSKSKYWYSSGGISRICRGSIFSEVGGIWVFNSDQIDDSKNWLAKMSLIKGLCNGSISKMSVIKEFESESMVGGMIYSNFAVF